MPGEQALFGDRLVYDLAIVDGLIFDQLYAAVKRTVQNAHVGSPHHVSFPVKLDV